MNYTFDLKNNEIENRLAFTFWYEHSQTSSMLFNVTCNIEHSSKFFKFLDRRADKVDSTLFFEKNKDCYVIVKRKGEQ